MNATGTPLPLPREHEELRARVRAAAVASAESPSNGELQLQSAKAIALIARTDLIEERGPGSERLAFDYEGDDHRVRRDVWLRDIERRELMEDAGWRVIRVTAADLFTHPDAFIGRVRRIIAGRQ